jgi:hypothetical protein
MSKLRSTTIHKQTHSLNTSLISSIVGLEGAKHTNYTLINDLNKYVDIKQRFELDKDIILTLEKKKEK